MVIATLSLLCSKQWMKIALKRMKATQRKSSDSESLEILSSSSASQLRMELLPLQGCTSRVWQYFGFPARDGRFVEPDKKK